MGKFYLKPHQPVNVIAALPPDIYAFGDSSAIVFHLRAKLRRKISADYGRVGRGTGVGRGRGVTLGVAVGVGVGVGVIVGVAQGSSW